MTSFNPFIKILLR